MPPNGVEVESDAKRIEVIVRHATNGLEMKVVLPANAKFKHVKMAMARRLESDEVLTRGQLINNTGGIYNAFKDNHRVGSVREILALCVDMEPPDDGPMEAVLEDDDLTDEEEAKAVARTPATASSKSSVFNRERAVSLQQELLQGFKAAEFQEKLAALQAKRKDMASEAHFAKQRQELFLSVQSVVLPSYGFEGSQSGVYKMMGAMGPFINDPEFVRLANDINRVIGLASPQDSWAALSKSCRKVEDQPREPARQPQHRPPARARGLPGLLGGGLGGLGGGFGSFAAPAPMPMPGAAPLGGTNGSTKPSAGVASPAAAPGKNGSTKPAPAAGAASPGAARGPSTFAPEPRAGAGAQRPTADRGPVATAPPPEPVRGAGEEEEAPMFEPWPSGRTPPFKLFVAGSWNDYKPTQMQWQDGMFACPITLGPDGCENFQLLENGSWDRTLYPSAPDASALDEHGVCGPDARGHGVNWQIGKYEEEEARPRARFVIIAGLDKSGAVRLVSWQPVG